MPAAARRLPAYKSVLLVAGVLLIMFGVANWVTGALRTRPYANYLRLHPGPRLRSPNLKAELLEPPDDERQERDVARPSSSSIRSYRVEAASWCFSVLYACSEAGRRAALDATRTSCWVGADPERSAPKNPWSSLFLVASKESTPANS